MDMYIAPLFGGILIGLAATLMMLANGKICGVSGIATNIPYTSKADRPWRLAFVIGLITGPLLVGTQAIGAPVADIPTTAAAGLLVGIGTTMGNGCTSGHGVCGIARLSKRSIYATLTFFAAAVITVFLTHHVLGK